MANKNTCTSEGMKGLCARSRVTVPAWCVSRTKTQLWTLLFQANTTHALIWALTTAEVPPSHHHIAQKHISDMRWLLITQLQDTDYILFSMQIWVGESWSENIRLPKRKKHFLSRHVRRTSFEGTKHLFLSDSCLFADWSGSPEKICNFLSSEIKKLIPEIRSSPLWHV